VNSAASPIVEQYGDLQEYGLSLGVDLEAEADEDLAWAVREAFNAPLPSGWTEYMDDSGRAYYIKDGSIESTWEHPADRVYRELFALIRDVRHRDPPWSEDQREEAVRQHLKEVHQRAKTDLQGWSGPYASAEGEYYYSDVLKLSSWDCPVIEWEKELASRHAVLMRYLVPEQMSTGTFNAEDSSVQGSASGHQMLQALRLQLGDLQRAPGYSSLEFVPEPSTSRSYHTARSHGSSRSGRTKHHSERSKDRKERKQEREQRRIQREELGQGGASAALDSNRACQQGNLPTVSFAPMVS